MIIKLANGEILSPILVTGAKRNIQDANRDVLSFVFSADADLNELDNLFNSENCEIISIIDGDKEYIHNAYTIRVELKREPVVVVPATESSGAIYENRTTVSMAQRTYTESQMAEMQATMNALLIEEE